MRNRYITIIVVLVIVNLILVWQVYAGALDSPNYPDQTSSYSLEGIYNRLNDGTAGKKKAFTEPSSGPPSGTTGTGHTLDEIMAKAPALDNTNGATTTQVMSGTTYWGLRDGAWGLQTGALATQTVDNSTVNQAAGYYNTFNLSVVDTDLVAGNIKQGVNLFGVDGTGPIAYTYTLGVPKTGQTKCYTATASSEEECPEDSGNFPGQDGDYQKGVAWPVPRFITGTTGIVTDTLTGLIWLADANCTTFFSGDGASQNNRSWSNALTATNSLAAGYCGLTDGSSAGDWRLPNVRELQSLVHYGFPSSPSDYAVPNTAGTGKWSEGDPFSNIQLGLYWSSSTFTSKTFDAWFVVMHGGSVDFGQKIKSNYVWPVRGGQ